MAVTGWKISTTQLLQNDYFIALLIVLAGIIIAKIVDYILHTYVKRITEKTKSDLDDRILKAISKPLYSLIIVISLYFAFKKLAVFNQYALIIDNFFFIAAVFNVAYLVGNFFGVLITHWLKVQKKYEQTPKLISKIVAVFFYIVAILVILDYFKIEITPLVATLGLGGLAIGLALQDTLSNFFAGVHIMTDKPIDIGDVIEIESGLSETGTLRGVVEDIGWRSTRIRVWNNDIVVIPNSKLASSIVVNRSLPNEAHVFDVPCGVAYTSDLKKVEKVALEVAKHVQKTSEFANKDFEPVFRYKAFGESNIDFFVLLSSKNFGSKFPLRSEFIKALKERFDKEGIEISWPVRKIYYGESNDKKIKKKK
ncbi:MAG: mechanosensitive ion channel family protein [Candidatus Aenigmatarchaeota archaeon]